MREWHLDIEEWPGPDRKKWPGLRDVIQESPEGRYVAIVYSCGEVDIYKEVGLFALFAGPPDSPRLLLRPRGLKCFVWQDGTTVQWIGERFCVVTPYYIRQRLVGSPRSFGGTLYLDVEQRKAAYVPGAFSGGAIPGLPEGLVWRGWKWLSLWPWLWPMRKPCPVSECTSGLET
jgi:hypothetical protein